MCPFFFFFGEASLLELRELPESSELELEELEELEWRRDFLLLCLDPDLCFRLRDGDGLRADLLLRGEALRDADLLLRSERSREGGASVTGLTT